MRNRGARASIAPPDPGLSAEQAQELRATADLFESVVESSGFDLSTLESLREIYAQLGDETRLAHTLERLVAAQSAPPKRAAQTVSPEAAPPRIAAPPRRPAVVPADDIAPAAPAARSAPPARPASDYVLEYIAPPAEEPPAPTRPSFVAAKSLERAPAAPAAPVAPPTLERRPAPRAHARTLAAEPGAKPARRRGRLGELLVAEGIISQEQLQDALREHRRSKERLGAVLARRGLVSEERLVELLSREHGLPTVDISQHMIPADVMAMVPAHIVRRYEVLPLSRAANGLTLAMADPTNVVAMDEIAAMTRLTVLPVVASGAAIRAAIDRHYHQYGKGEPMADVLAELSMEASSLEVMSEDEQLSAGNVIELRESADEAPVVRLVNMILVDAIRRGASDLHWEPYEREFRIRFRIDGVLHEMLSPPKRHEPAIISRLKIMANLDIAERRAPQDGRIKLRYGSREIDFRVSILPAIFGEKAVLRILDKDALQLDLGKLGFDPWAYEKFNDVIRQPHGMVLITGPTGSGKTTTLYSAISTINSPDHNIMTAEDPVEYNLRGVNQIQVNEGVGRSFAQVLRSFLRQDPDVILVGETRDLETAQISIRAALTGHLVFTTLHTNDCPSTIARLIDMGVQPFLLSSALMLILAQRLGRKICTECKEPYEGHEDQLVPLGHVRHGVGKVTFYKGRGCQTCNFTGMKGRVAIYEVMPITEELRDLILKDASTAELRELAQAQGMRTLRQAGLQKVLEGTTTAAEVLRVTMS
jgi:type IV pilus assembly protein PilB